MSDDVIVLEFLEWFNGIIVNFAYNKTEPQIQMNLMYTYISEERSLCVLMCYFDKGTYKNVKMLRRTIAGSLR